MYQDILVNVIFWSISCCIALQPPRTYVAAPSNKKLTWWHARDWCRINQGTDLATITTEVEWNTANTACQTVTSEGCWIGLERFWIGGAYTDPNTYQWSDGTNFDQFSYGGTFNSDPWESTEPKGVWNGNPERCVAIEQRWNYNGRWNDDGCCKEFNFICNAPTSAPTLSPTDSPSESPSKEPTDEPTDEPTQRPTPCPECKSTAPLERELKRLLAENSNLNFQLSRIDKICHESTLCRKAKRILKGVCERFESESRRRLSSNFESRAKLSEILVNIWKEDDIEYVSVSIPFCGTVSDAEDDALIKMFADIVHVSTTADYVVVEKEMENHKFDGCKHKVQMVTIRQKSKNSYKDMTVKVVASALAAVSVVVVVRYILVR